MREYKRLLKYSTIFSIICVILFWVVGYIGLPEAIEYYMEYGLFAVCPILLAILWIMTLRRYLSVELERNGANRRLAILCSVIPVIVFCVVFFCYADALLSYLTYHWAYIERLWDCLAIKLGLAMGWLACWIVSVKTKRFLAEKEKVIRKLVLFTCYIILCVTLLCVSIITREYIHDRTEEEWYSNMVEEAQKEFVIESLNN